MRSRTAGMPSGRGLPSPLGIQTRRKGRGLNVLLLSSRIRASKFWSRLFWNRRMLTLSIPAAPRLRLTLRKAVRIRVSVILPVNECALILATRRSFPAELLETTDGRFGATRPWRMFLSKRPLPGEAGRAVGSALGVRASYPHGFAATILLTTDSPLIPTRRDYCG